MSAAGRGMPLLSGSPPNRNVEEESCHKCNKEFNLLFARSRKCMHCGYLYCHSCSDYQALIPRSGSEAGYDSASVCSYCIENLNITARTKNQLRTLPLARLKKYANAYNIPVGGVLEKDELIDAILSARGSNGCLLPTHEDYYRKHSIPNRSNERPRGFFSRARDAMSGAPPGAQQQQPPSYQRQRTTSHPSHFARPDLDARNQQQPRPQNTRPAPSTQYAPPPGPPPGRSPQYAPPPGPPPSFPQPNTSYTSNHSYSFHSGSNLNVPPTGRPRSASTPRAAANQRATSPARPVPTIDELLDMSEDSIAALSIGSLKAVLFQHHVNARLVVEKSELVSKVKILVEDERRERADAAWRAEEEEREMQQRAAQLERERRAREHPAPPSPPHSEEQGAHTEEGSGDNHTSEPTPSAVPTGRMSPRAQAAASHLERTGLCVICQDEEANIAVVDCGHLAMCRNCSDLVMKSSRECPLCRTRIVTEARLLRIFKT